MFYVTFPCTLLLGIFSWFIKVPPDRHTSVAMIFFTKFDLIVITFSYFFQAGKLFHWREVSNHPSFGLCERKNCLSLLCIISEENSNERHWLTVDSSFVKCIIYTPAHKRCISKYTNSEALVVILAGSYLLEKSLFTLILYLLFPNNKYYLCISDTNFLFCLQMNPT